jgi:hypothetical protein
VLTGSANFTPEGLTSQANLLHIFRSAPLAKLYANREALLTKNPSVPDTARGAPVEIHQSRKGERPHLLLTRAQGQTSIDRASGRGEALTVAPRNWRLMSFATRCRASRMAVSASVRAGYDVARLTTVFTSERRADLAIKHFRSHACKAALCCCVSIDHARYMAQVFSAAGIPELAVHSDPDSADRAKGVRDLTANRVTILFVVDLFNEGVDIPCVDLVMFLRRETGCLGTAAGRSSRSTAPSDMPSLRASQLTGSRQSPTVTTLFLRSFGLY